MLAVAPVPVWLKGMVMGWIGECGQWGEASLDKDTAYILSSDSKINMPHTARIRISTRSTVS